MKAVLATALCLTLLASAGYSAIVYVDPGSAINGPGNDWLHAYHTVTAGLAVASNYDEVWVVKGTYYELITLKAGVGLYGGFAGNESDRRQRDFVLNLTILDGNLEGTVVTVPSGATTTCVIDGFVIRNGSAGYNGNGVGIRCASASPTIANNTIIDNAYHGIHCTSSSAKIVNNTIASNTACGIFCSGSSDSIENNTIRNNKSDGISCYTGGNTTICSNLITGQVSDTSAAIVCNNSSPSITSNTLAGNYYGIFCQVCTSGITNNIVAFNSCGIGVNQATPVLKNNCVYGNSMQNYLGLSAGTGDMQKDPKFVDMPKGNFHLSENSPCIHGGSTSVVPGTRDIDDERRVYGNIPDIGADEWWPGIGITKLSPDNALVLLSGNVVTATFPEGSPIPEFFYMESLDRSAGLRVKVMYEPRYYAVRDRVDVTGTIETDASGERYVDGGSIERFSTAGLKPVGMASRWLGGGDFNYDPVTKAGQQGVMGGAGVNNVGLLVKVWGRVTFSGAGFFYISDGSPVIDSSGYQGVKVIGSVPVLPGVNPVGKLVAVTGISTCEKPAGDVLRMIRPRSAADVQTVD